MDSVIFAQARMAIYYDRKHNPITFKPGDKVFITIATGIQPSYRLPNNVSTKLSECRIGPFTVLDTVGRLAYKLDISKSWNIYPIISVVHLEHFKSDKYSRDIGPPPAELIKDDSGTHEEYEVEAIIAKQYNKWRKRTEYLIQWKRYGPEHNTWEPTDHLRNAEDLLRQFESTDINFISTLFLPQLPSLPRLPCYKTNITLWS